MSKPKSWEVKDDFWRRVKPLVPVRQRSANRTHIRRTGRGCTSKNSRLVFEAIVHVSYTGWQSRVLPFEPFWQL